MATWTTGKLLNTKFEVLPAGEYPAVIKSVTQGIQATGKLAGSEKITLEVVIDNRSTIRDNIIIAPSLGWKLNQLSHSLGNKEGEKCELDDSLVGVRLRVKLSVNEVPKKDGNGVMRVNRIERYVPATKADAANDDDVNF